jgi:hypothetical protein
MLLAVAIGGYAPPEPVEGRALEPQPGVAAPLDDAIEADASAPDEANEDAAPPAPEPRAPGSERSAPDVPRPKPQPERPRPAEEPDRDVPLPELRPLRWRVDLGVGLAANAIFHGAYRAFDRRDRQMLAPDVRMRADVRLGASPVFLGAGLAYQRFATRGRPYDGALDTRLVVHEPQAFVRLSVLVREGFDLFGEVGAGPTIANLEIAGTSVHADQRRITGSWAAQAGALVYLPRRWLPGRGTSRATAGLELALGYMFRGPIDVEPVPAVADDAIATDSVAFGDVSLRGLAWRLGLVVRFM